jgi:hypothetical protein
VGWLFQDVTEAKQTEQEAALLRFRTNQLHRAARAAAECEDPAEAASVHLDFALAGFADHALIDRVAGGSVPDGEGPVRLVRAAATPSGAPGPSLPAGRAGLPVRYADGHPALQCVERIGSVRASAGAARAGAGASEPERAREWASRPAVASGLRPCAVCGVAQSGADVGCRHVSAWGQSYAVRAAPMRSYAEDVAVRIAAALDLGEALEGRG